MGLEITWVVRGRLYLCTRPLGPPNPWFSSISTPQKVQTLDFHRFRPLKRSKIVVLRSKIRVWRDKLVLFGWNIGPRLWNGVWIWSIWSNSCPQGLQIYGRSWFSISSGYRNPWSHGLEILVSWSGPIFHIYRSMDIFDIHISIDIDILIPWGIDIYRYRVSLDLRS